ncbi:S-formylglutathione hydrolase [Vibrio tapetis subsp. quintayensis]|uniref:S-formylglutathione hydrolase n=1 Tax=Vibrio tapetis TaxID=52443 RepID=UPI0025B524A3|nr:S-formylglutathione hydrolase [Vibrio tapetis]MDN3680062.1 S-formylglutathione hydrolase [Vibrio tapetis subsp. quintayensis]
MTITNISQTKAFGGWHKQYSHTAQSLNCDMRFAIYLPPNASSDTPVPVLYWLSGLTCTDENFMQKSGAFKAAAELGIAIVAPDTSPRGEGVADDPDGSYDLGLGAGFYVNATQKPWSDHYQMYSYVVDELPKLIEAHFPVSNVRSIAGHSMGGHGALTIGLRNSDHYRSISAFSPIVHPTHVPWGQKAFQNYLGSNQETWKQYDSCELIKSSRTNLPILIDQGDRDNFLLDQLKPQFIVDAAKQSGSDITLRMQPGYDHSYFFISSFIEEHLRFHHQHLND